MSYISNAFSGKNSFIRYFIGFVLIIIASQIVGALPLLTVVMMKKLNGFHLNPDNPADLSVLGLSQNTSLILMLIPFIVGLVAIWLVVKYIHGRTLLQTVTGRKKFSWKRFLQAAGFWLLLMVIIQTVQYLITPENFEWNFQPGSFYILILISLFLIPLQTSFEELLFRGYLMQGLITGTRNRWLPLLFTTFLFGGLHIFNPEVKEFGIALALPQYFTLGLVLGISVLMDDGLELALGVHAINNVFLAMFFTFDASALQTPALFKIKNIDPLADLITLVIASILFILWASYKYKWKNWRNNLTGEVITD
jgi:membrane protease YdiL (CAAX protease family)